MCELNADADNIVGVPQLTVAYLVSFIVHKMDVTSRHRWKTGFVVIFSRYWFSTSQQKIRQIQNGERRWRNFSVSTPYISGIS